LYRRACLAGDTMGCLQLRNPRPKEAMLPARDVTPTDKVSNP
jgi:hypothetical protein